MDYWGKMTNISKESAEQHIKVLNSFSSEKKFMIALQWGEMSVNRNREIIRNEKPYLSPLEVTLEYVRRIHFEEGKMSVEQWAHFQDVMRIRIKKDWVRRFRKMLK